MAIVSTAINDKAWIAYKQRYLPGFDDVTEPPQYYPMTTSVTDHHSAFDHISKRNPSEHLCMNCQNAVAKIWSPGGKLSGFGLFRPRIPTMSENGCMLCAIIEIIQSSYMGPRQERVKQLLQHTVPVPHVSAVMPRVWKNVLALSPNGDISLGTARVMKRSKISANVVKSWISVCEMKHADTCQSTFKSASGTQSETSLHRIILIDVQNFNLVIADTHARYVALSYVWGIGDHFRLTEASFDWLIEKGALREVYPLIPRTIQDAIQFTKDIGERYLWVDSLCVSQDSPTKLEEISIMSEIYNSALVTFVAVESKGAMDPLPGVREGSRVLRTFYEAPDITLAARNAYLAPTVINSYYNKRAWTFQERLLSPRCLYFTSEQAVFQCQSSTFFEDRTEDQHNTRDLSYVNPITRHLFRSRSEGVVDSVTVYFSTLRSYLTKLLTYESDRLNAFLGISDAVGRLIQSNFVFGLPTSYLCHGLLFQTNPTGCSRRRSTMADMKNDDFPTWSWLGWSDTIYYRYDNLSSIKVCIRAFKCSFLRIQVLFGLILRKLPNQN
jgi:hypothetical protein